MPPRPCSAPRRKNRRGAWLRRSSHWRWPSRRPRHQTAARRGLLCSLRHVRARGCCRWPRWFSSVQGGADRLGVQGAADGERSAQYVTAGLDPLTAEIGVQLVGQDRRMVDAVGGERQVGRCCNFGGGLAEQPRKAAGGRHAEINCFRRDPSLCRVSDSRCSGRDGCGQF
ncbi:hypothetical protein SI859A1_00929 [Aurantimonas manganoxydans SI85-9A1]|uniref:Uncharacterized protein n=1 Tax=Aurantimonas manganoxydans (strain ATCC BAA-1229 / DSM 21871 / SI85-9A1) TaxID=287752 RepID=Q1YJR9_AURMS|nr:hypothetical protein SI859A1_00929 [Aurantimonas manganoxydans SI85-9A1]